jgi:hypothetical protein
MKIEEIGDDTLLELKPDIFRREGPLQRLAQLRNVLAASGVP